MISIDGIYEDLFVINKSKFLAFVYPVFNEDEARKQLNILREKYSDATHVCSAYSLSSPRLEKADDDGEPCGTAGKPMLELIKKKGLENILLVVVRYFGGIKLGAGGLVRAYTSAGNLVLDKARVVNMVSIDEYKATIDISLGSRLQESIRSLGGQITSCVYCDKVEIEFSGDICEKIRAMYPSVEIDKIGSKIVCQK
jgi:uncharacterized YigZ family protein